MRMNEITNAIQPAKAKIPPSTTKVGVLFLVPLLLFNYDLHSL